jgi:hypothetical protein
VTTTLTTPSYTEKGLTLLACDVIANRSWLRKKPTLPALAAGSSAWTQSPWRDVRQ